MNDTNAIKAIALHVSNYFGDGGSAESAMDSIGRILKVNSTANPSVDSADKTSGFRVIDPEGGTHNYPNATAVHVDRCDLYLLDENNKSIAIFHRWEHVKRSAS